jgi:hypothetical protein
MFLFLSKTLPPFIYPLGLSCVLILAAILLSRFIRLQRAILILALTIALGEQYPLGINGLAAFSGVALLTA